MVTESVGQQLDGEMDCDMRGEFGSEFLGETTG